MQFEHMFEMHVAPASCQTSLQSLHLLVTWRADVITMKWDAMDWSWGDSALTRVVQEQTDACLAVYREDPSRVEQDANNELRIAEGGYRDRQLLELVQNAVDAARDGGHRVEVRLGSDTLYVANDGAPFDADGVRAIMGSDLSPKHDERIGRFGIGFKSVLAVTSEPRVYSRSVSFAFDATWAQDTIRAAGFTSPRYPVMRLARVLEPGATEDPAVRELMDWATTVVVLPLREHRDRLAKDVRSFPEEFLLFSPHVTLARFVDAEPPEQPHDRTVEREEVGDRTVIRQGRRRRSFTVLRSTWRPGPAARADAGRLADRDVVEISWAIPNPPTADVGTFWAYFPTLAHTTLAGIVNAPWKLSDDRTGLLAGAFNQGLLTEALPRLLAENLQRLYDPERPCAHLDALPARGREQRNWADGVVNQPVFDALQTRASVPDCTGALRVPTDLRLMPEDLRSEWVEEWRESGFAPLRDWAHWELDQTAERRLKVRRLIGLDPDNNPDVSEWLECLAATKSPEASAAALRLAAKIVRSPGASDRLIESVLAARVLLLEDGNLVRPVRGKVFVRASDDDRAGTFVHSSLAGFDGVRECLESLGVSVLDRRGELQQVLVQGPRTETDWHRVWLLARELPDRTVRELFESELPQPIEAAVRVRTAKGSWRPLTEVLLPGSVVTSDGQRDLDVLVDPRFHAEDLELLRELGAVSEPVWRDGAPAERWLGAYEQAMKDHFIKHATGSKPSPEHLVVEGPQPPWPLAVLENLSAEGRVVLTQHVLARGTPRAWTVRHRTNRSYGSKSVIAPEIWVLRKAGMVQTAFGPVTPARAVLPSDELPEDALPVATELPTSGALKIGVREVPDEFTRADWLHLKSLADRWSDDSRRTEFYTWLPDDLRPETLVARVGHRREPVAIENVGVTTSRTIYEGLIEAHVPAMLVASETDAERFIATWGMPEGKDLLRQEVVADEAGEPGYLVDEFPPLKLFPRLSIEDYELKLQPCSRLVRLVATPQGQKSRDIPALRDGGRVLVTATEPGAVLRQVSDVLALDLTAADIARVLSQMAASQASAFRTQIRAAAQAGGAAALVEAVGLDALRGLIPAPALEAVEAARESTPDDVARLALAVHGVSILKQLQPVLEERGLEPPREFAGRAKERRWVTDLGFPAEWAGFAARPAPAREVVEGPVVLKPLHRYQEKVTERIRALLAGIGRERGVVSLPTGAGKTRVTVQALVEEIAAGRLSGPVMWIAQSEELCAQAAESWAYVWRAIGPDHPLVLSRLWGSNEVEEEPDGTQVVIAIDAKLDSVLERSDDLYDWLRDPTVVVVDEAHTSVSPRYTKLFEWLGRSGRKRSDRGLVIGLTATPFRGRSDEETKRLVRRYAGNLLDEGVLGDNPYAELQAMGVLAQVDRRVLDGVTVEFDDKQRSEIEATNRFPAQMAEALGQNRERSQRIVDSILTLPEDWQILLFAPSVESSRVLAALLSYHGVPSVAVTGTTATTARRHYIDQFRAGSLRVLTNYNVLTQGFDAPAVRAVYVCRPTFSPNVYQQMVGRGLRGPLNGGSEEVRIVDVEDNLNVFGDRLAFREFERLWRQ